MVMAGIAYFCCFCILNLHEYLAELGKMALYIITAWHYISMSLASTLSKEMHDQHQKCIKDANHGDLIARRSDENTMVLHQTWLLNRRTIWT